MNTSIKSFARMFQLIVMLLCLTTATHGQSVPIIVDAYLPDLRSDAPVTFGVPFPKNTLATKDVSRVRIVDDNGAVTPHQQAVTATWDPSGKQGVRWLLIDMVADADRQYTLHYAGPQVAEPGAKRAPMATLTGSAIRLNTGLYRGTVRTKGFNLFASLRFRDAPITHRGRGVFSAFYVEHEKRGVFRSDLDPNATVKLEEAGPIRVTLKADGWYMNKSGGRFCRYSIRVHFFRDRPEIKIEHTFIFTGLSSKDRIAALGMKVQRTAPRSISRSYTYVGDDNLVTATPVSSASHVVQIASERDRLDFYTPLADGKAAKHANRGGGWMTCEGAARFSVAIRDAWQQYPWGLKFDAGALDVQLWPREAGPLDTTWDGYWSDLTDRQKRYMSDTMARRTDMDVDRWMAKLREANATGAAKTHEFWFSPAIDRQLPRKVAYPVLAHADLAWMCASQALDLQPHVSADAGLFDDEEIVLRQMLAMMQQAVRTNHWYGWWDWGAYHQSLNTEGMSFPRFGLWADDAGMDRWHRARPKSHYQWGRFPWLQYMRTGDRDWLRYAQTFTLYSADRAHSHHSGNGRDDGSEFHYDNSFVPWLGGYRKYPGGDQLWSPLQSKDDYVYAWWLTGSRRALDVLEANGRLLMAADNPVRFKPGFERGNDIRNAGMMLERVMMLYQATWDERYRALADRIAALFLPLDTPEKVVKAEFDSVNNSNFHQAATWAYQGMWFYDRIAGDPAFRKVLQLFIDRSRDVTAGFVECAAGQNGSPRALTYGYLLTGDTLYLDLARPGWDALAGRGISPLQFNPGGKQELSGMPGLLGAMATAPKAWRDTNLPMRNRGTILTWRGYTRNNDPYHAGTRAFIREQTDGPWHFVIASNSGGTFVLHRPDGRVAATKKLDSRTLNWARFDVPSDGQTGSYAVVCTALDPHANPSRAQLTRIVDCALPVVIEIGLPGRDLGVYGRSYCFMADTGAEQSSVSVIPMDPKRCINFENASGSIVASTQGRVPYMHARMTINLFDVIRDQVLAMRFSLDPHIHHQRDESSRLWSFNGIHPFLAGTPEDYFIPDIPNSLPPLRPDR